MKKIILAFSVLGVIATANAQKKIANATSFSIGVEAGLPVGDFNDAGYNFGIGGSAQVDHKIATDAALTLNVGYLNYANKSSSIDYHFSVIPVLAGVKYWFSPKVYGSAQLGAAFNSTKISNSNSGSSTSTGFAYSPGIGINLTNSIDLLVKYFGNSVNSSTISNFGVRLAYNFGK
jgi:opacity protein-like surface antigen